MRSFNLMINSKFSDFLLDLNRFPGKLYPKASLSLVLEMIGRQQDPTKTGPYRIYFYSHEPNESPHVHIDRDNDSCKFWLDPVALNPFFFTTWSRPGARPSNLRATTHPDAAQNLGLSPACDLQGEYSHANGMLQPCDAKANPGLPLYPTRRDHERF